MNDTSKKINALAKIVGAQSYLEVGVQEGNTIQHVQIQNKTGIDPNLSPVKQEVAADANCTLIESESDLAWSDARLHKTFDIIFIDGLHTHTQSYRDFLNSLRYAKPTTVWLIDDTIPSDFISSLSSLKWSYRLRKATFDKRRQWMGDVYRTPIAIARDFPTANLLTTMADDGAKGQTTVFFSHAGSKVLSRPTNMASSNLPGFRSISSKTSAWLNTVSTEKMLETVHTWRTQS